MIAIVKRLVEVIVKDLWNPKFLLVVLADHTKCVRVDFLDMNDHVLRHEKRKEQVPLMALAINLVQEFEMVNVLASNQQTHEIEKPNALKRQE